MIRPNERMYLNELIFWGGKQFDPFGLDHIKCHHNTHHHNSPNKFRVERTTRHLSENPSTYLR